MHVLEGALVTVWRKFDRKSNLFKKAPNLGCIIGNWLGNTLLQSKAKTEQVLHECLQLVLRKTLL